ncbi:hypothetical protein [Lentilactobacillus rapi]|uniref:hypothetical protein n=1 Tax=Lentilactobacillus rapi TaxID=481723 RepID=UPI000AA851A5|nr:hypothetical protein [Lentilactobacillus rapi]
MIYVILGVIACIAGAIVGVQAQKRRHQTEINNAKATAEQLIKKSKFRSKRKIRKNHC